MFSLELREMEVVSVLIGEIAGRPITIDHLLERVHPLLGVGVTPDQEGETQTRRDLSQRIAEHLGLARVVPSDWHSAVGVQIEGVLAMESDQEAGLAVPASQDSVELTHGHQVAQLGSVPAVDGLPCAYFAHH